MNKRKNNKSILIRKLKNRISWLENLVSRCSVYINKLEAELKELKQDHRKLVNWYWDSQKIIEENEKIKNENKDLKRSNKALKLLLKEMIDEIEKKNFSLDLITLEEVNKKKITFDWINDGSLNEDVKEIDHEKPDISELKSDLKKVATKQINLDIKV